MSVPRKTPSVMCKSAPKQLGMSLTSASKRLVRMLLFDFIQRNGEDKCYRCGKKIESIRDLSIDHKQPWLNDDPALYWDLENIGFSHKGCNSGARRPEHRWGSIQEAGRESFHRWYVKPGNREIRNARQRARYHQKKNLSGVEREVAQRPVFQAG